MGAPDVGVALPLDELRESRQALLESVHAGHLGPRLDRGLRGHQLRVRLDAERRQEVLLVRLQPGPTATLRQGATVGVQLGALVFGTLTVAMAWCGTEGPGKPVAAGLAALAWAVLTALALTGSWATTTVINEPTAAAPAPVNVVDIPEPRIEAVVVDVQQLQVDINGRRLTGDDDQN
jgi:hypothetical protein